jgi:hypothetical protein
MPTDVELFDTPSSHSETCRRGFVGIEPEMTAKIAKVKGLRIYEVPISYFGRTYEEGKKIGWKDGVSAIRCIIKYNLFTSYDESFTHSSQELVRECKALR